jgi:hypothetical protein
MANILTFHDHMLLGSCNKMPSSPGHPVFVGVFPDLWTRDTEGNGTYEVSLLSGDALLTSDQQRSTGPPRDSVSTPAITHPRRILTSVPAHRSAIFISIVSSSVLLVCYQSSRFLLTFCTYGCLY